MSHRTASALRRIVGSWPWLILALALVPAIYRVVDFPSDIDPEYPEVFRPVFSRFPPLAYRLAEPGDRLDQLAVGLAAGAILLAARGLVRSHGRGTGLWPAALALALGVFWYASIPRPSPDGWSGWGWDSMVNPAAPAAQRLIGAGVALGLLLVMARSIRAAWGPARELWNQGCARGNLGLLATALILVGVRLGEVPRVEPAGYWPRWALVWGLLAWDLALIRATAGGRSGGPGLPAEGFPGRRWIGLATWGTAWGALAALGLALGWYHRPLDRLEAVVPEKIYISAMPAYRSLELVHHRHHFKTIINLFPEETPWRSPLLPDELKFAREQGIRYLDNPGHPLAGDSFIEQTLALACDPDAWPILVHCHACYDRTPAWVGIYRFVVQGRPLGEILREMERHRGSRPKASVTLLYNRVLSTLAPERYARDPTAQRLRHYAAGATETTLARGRSARDDPGTDRAGF